MKPDREISGEEDVTGIRRNLSTDNHIVRRSNDLNIVKGKHIGRKSHETNNRSGR